MLSILLSAKEYTKSFAFTSDMSKTKNLYSLISLTVHFIAPDGELMMLNLHSDYFGENRHTGGNILFCLQSMMNECGLDDDSIGRYIVLDNASNNKRAMNLGSDKYDVVWCVIHTLQLAIKVSEDEDIFIFTLLYSISGLTEDKAGTGVSWSSTRKVSEHLHTCEAFRSKPRCPEASL